MKIYFRHYAGAITEYDYLFFDCMAKVGAYEEDIALQEGWLPDDYTEPKKMSNNFEEDKSDWFQARQTRIDLSLFKEDRRTRKARKKCKDITTKVFRATEVDLNILNSIFDKYINYRGFKTWELEPLIKREKYRKHFILYYYNDKPIAFTFIRDVGSFDSFATQFAWDYEMPKLYLGKYANLAEIDYCIAKNKKYMYIGAGYEKACIYKSDYAGFEFWTGEKWSKDVEHYKFLCERDSSIVKTQELDEIKEHDDKFFFDK
tara:strand:+ start:5429 stop:6208 length:780 start_codon:yes stop_codon:yes gene_type:complete